MNRRSAIKTLIGAAAGALFAGDDPQDFVIHSDVRLVVLDVSVRDRSGALVPGLHQENFAVYENGVAQTVTVFANSDVPVTVGIVVDESRSMAPKRAEVLSAAETFISSSNPRDEIFVLNFNERVKRGLPEGVPFSDDLAQLGAALDRGFPEGKTALYDAVVQALDQLTHGKRDKKALMVISDGGDNASRHSRKQMLDALERSTATVYAIGLFDPDDPDRNPGVLKELARISGGDAFFPEKPADMTDVCKAIAHQIRTRYTIGYIPAASNGGDLRRIQVKVKVPGRGRIEARTRTRYLYSNPDSNPAG